MKLNKHTSLKHYEGWIYCRAAIVLEHLRVINWQLSSQCLLIKWNWYFWKGEKLSAHPSSSSFLLPHLARKRKRKSFFFCFFPLLTQSVPLGSAEKVKQSAQISSDSHKSNMHLCVFAWSHRLNTAIFLKQVTVSLKYQSIRKVPGVVI